MRIIKKGQLKETEKTCKRCNTVFAYTDSDLLWMPMYPDGGTQISDCYNIKCPLCGNVEKANVGSNS